METKHEEDMEEQKGRGLPGVIATILMVAITVVWRFHASWLWDSVAGGQKP
jgi:flagellin-like protein